MRLYVRAIIVNADGKRITQNVAIAIQHAEAMTDDKAETLLNRIKEDLQERWGEGCEVESIEFVPEQALEIKTVRNRKPYVWHHLYYKALGLNISEDGICFVTDAVFEVDVKQNPTLLSREEKDRIRDALIELRRKSMGSSPYDMQEISPYEFDRLLSKGADSYTVD